MDNTGIGKIIRTTGLLLEIRDGPSSEAAELSRGGSEIARLPRQLAWSPPEKWPEPAQELPESVRKAATCLIETGALPLYEELRSAIPPGLIEMLELPDFSANRIRLLHSKLRVESIDDLEQACRDGRVASLSEFDEDSQGRMLEAIAFWRSNKDLHHLHTAWVAATPLLEGLRNLPFVIRAEVTGCLRRWTETVPGVSLLISTAEADTEKALDFFTRLPEVARVTARETAEASVVLRGGLRATLRVVGDHVFPFALLRYTGNTEHRDALCQRALDRGMELNPFGLYRKTDNDPGPGRRVTCHREEDIYYALGLDYIPPELREGGDEIEVAAAHEIPQLLEWTALRGSLHSHSTWSDGRQTLEELAADAYEMGCSYWAVTDHSVSNFVGKGLKEKELIAQVNEVELINQQYQDRERPFRLLSGVEVDIKAGGQLDFADEVLGQLDVVVASIHQALAGSEAQMTKRLIAAAENRHVHMLGHLTGRLLLQREGYRVNQRAVIDACAATGTWIELNASPWRFDMDWRLWRYARDQGVKCVINTNSHRPEHGQYLRFGAHIARKGWLTRHDVVNTLPLKRLRDALLRKRLAR